MRNYLPILSSRFGNKDLFFAIFTIIILSVSLSPNAVAQDNTPPTIDLIFPPNGQTVSSLEEIVFYAVAKDIEDGALSGEIIWHSSIDGQIGTSQSFQVNLSPGTHTITASVTDSGGLFVSEIVTVTVEGSSATEIPSETTGDSATKIPSGTGDSVTKIPDWVRNNAKWWAVGAIGDNDFVFGIQFLITEGIMEIPHTHIESDEVGIRQIPPWIKNNADWWSQGLISDDDFVKGIQYLIHNGIMVI